MKGYVWQQIHPALPELDNQNKNIIDVFTLTEKYTSVEYIESSVNIGN